MATKWQSDSARLGFNGEVTVPPALMHETNFVDFIRPRIMDKSREILLAR